MVYKHLLYLEYDFMGMEEKRNENTTIVHLMIWQKDKQTPKRKKNKERCKELEITTEQSDLVMKPFGCTWFHKKLKHLIQMVKNKHHMIVLI